MTEHNRLDLVLKRIVDDLTYLATYIVDAIEDKEKRDE